MYNERGEYVSPFGNGSVTPYRTDHWPHGFTGGPGIQPKLYSTKQTPRGSVVVLGDRIISEYEMPTPHAQQLADWLNDRRKHG
jgi:hypothetical protein